MLFYRILEKVLLSEQKSCKSVSAILEQDVFIKVNQFFFMIPKDSTRAPLRMKRLVWNKYSEE